VGKYKLGVMLKLQVPYWHSELVNELGDNWDVLTCPDGERPDITHTPGGLPGGPGSPGSRIQDTMSDVFIEVFVTRLDDPNDYRWDMYMREDSEWCWKLSQAQWDAYLGSPGHGKGYNYTGYVPDGNPDHYYYAWEDQGFRGGGDKDYWDMMLEVQHHPDRTDLTVRYGYSAFNFNLRRGDDREMLIHDMKQHVGEVKSFESWGTPGTPGPWGTGEARGEGTASYAMNSMAGEIAPGSGTILVLDYYQPVAFGSDQDDDEMDEGWLDEEVLASFVRHCEKLNVLFADQRVQWMIPDDITPYDAEARERYWNP